MHIVVSTVTGECSISGLTFQKVHLIFKVLHFPHTVYLCGLCDSDSKQWLYSINWLVFIMDTVCLLWARNRICKDSKLIVGFPGLRRLWWHLEGTRWRSWLRHCSTSRKVVGLIPDGVIGIFHFRNPSSRTMALGSTQPLTEMSTRSISWGVKAACG
jgi:hypothetical protein